MQLRSRSIQPQSAQSSRKRSTSVDCAPNKRSKSETPPREETTPPRVITPPPHEETPSPRVITPPPQIALPRDVYECMEVVATCCLHDLNALNTFRQNPTQTPFVMPGHPGYILFATCLRNKILNQSFASIRITKPLARNWLLCHALDFGSWLPASIADPKEFIVLKCSMPWTYQTTNDPTILNNVIPDWPVDQNICGALTNNSLPWGESTVEYASMFLHRHFHILADLLACTSTNTFETICYVMLSILQNMILVVLNHRPNLLGPEIESCHHICQQLPLNPWVSRARYYYNFAELKQTVDTLFGNARKIRAAPH